MSDRKTDTPASPSCYSDVIGQCRDIALIFSDAQVSELFEHAGGALLDFAERAENNTIQGRLFEAMALIQRKRPDIEHTFRHQLATGFDSLLHPSPSSHGDHEQATQPTDSELSLIAQEDMEESVACDNLVIKANADYYPELYELSQRFAAVSRSAKLRVSEVPAAPQQLVRAFRRALGGLDLEVRIKVILYALFDKFVVREAKGLYDELNSSLKAAGVLPNLRPTHARPPQQSAPGAVKSPRTQSSSDAELQPDSEETDALHAAERGETTLGAQLFSSILELMSAQHTQDRPSARRRAGKQSPIEQARAEASSRQLVSALDEVQSRKAADGSSAALPAGPGEIPNLEIDTAFLERIKQTLSAERKQVLSTIDRENLSPMDADLIDLIGMLFEYMLNDPVLPNLAKALLSHLHTPYLKVALIDRRLLVDAQHPARRLLDQMVEAGSLWVDESNPQRGIFPVMQQVVDRVLQEFSDDVSLFEELLEGFEARMAEQQRRTDTMEQRTQETARGREKLQLAKRRAEHHVQALLKGHPVPHPVSAFLRRTWLDQLVFILLRERQEERSDAWRLAVKTSEDLVALFAPHASETSAPRSRAEGISALKERIFEGVQRMGSYSHATVDALFALLDEPETWEEKVAAGQTTRTAESERATPKSIPAAPAAPEELGVERLTEQEQEVIKRLRRMKFGTWFEFSSDAGRPPRRIKLSWLSPLTSTCMFVDRSGMQAEINTLQELAREILSGRARVIPRPRHPFIERALVSIRKMLQGDGEGKEKGASREQAAPDGR